MRQSAMSRRSVAFSGIPRRPETGCLSVSWCTAFADPTQAGAGADKLLPHRGAEVKREDIAVSVDPQEKRNRDLWLKCHIFVASQW